MSVINGPPRAGALWRGTEDDPVEAERAPAPPARRLASDGAEVREHAA